MSVNITALAVSPAAPPPTEHQPRGNQRTRPIEPASSTLADHQRQNDSDTTKAMAQQKLDPEKAASNDRPFGKDRSIPPQTLFDASLISAAFKPDPKLNEISADENRPPAAVSDDFSPNPTGKQTSVAVSQADDTILTVNAQAASPDSATQIQDPTNRDNGTKLAASAALQNA